MTSEKALWSWLKKGNEDPRVFLYRVENSCFSGCPDVEGYIQGIGSVYIELKDSKYPVKDTTPIRFDVHTSQEYWHGRMTDLGSKCHMFLLQIDQDRFLVPGSFAKSLRAGVVKDWLNQYKLGKDPAYYSIKKYFERELSANQLKSMFS